MQNCTFLNYLDLTDYNHVDDKHPEVVDYDARLKQSSSDRTERVADDGTVRRRRGRSPDPEDNVDGIFSQGSDGDDGDDAGDEAEDLDGGGEGHDAGADDGGGEVEDAAGEGGAVDGAVILVVALFGEEWGPVLTALFPAVSGEGLDGHFDYGQRRTAKRKNEGGGCFDGGIWFIQSSDDHQ